MSGVLSEKPLTGEFLMDSVKNNETKETAVENITRKEPGRIITN